MLRRFSDQTGLGKGFVLTSGLRTCAKQNDIYAQGRTAPGPIVTNVKNCRSWHVHGRAFDLDFPGFSWERVTPLGEYWESLGGDWGGRFNDPGHFAWHPGKRIEEVCPDENSCRTIPMNPVSPDGFSKKAIQFIAATAATLGVGIYIVRKV